MKILITGANGMLAKDLIEVLSSDNELLLTDKDTLDITDEGEVNYFLYKNEPDLVINCAAYTLVDQAEELTERDLVWDINSIGVYNLSKYCAYNNIKFVQYSTDYVFDGKKKDGYVEEDEPSNPVNLYGTTKLKAEEYIMKFAQERKNFVYYIFRISWLYGKGGKNFVDTMLNLAKDKKELNIINDQFGSPTYTLDVAKRTKYILDKNLAKGIYHLTNEGETTWYQFASQIFKSRKINIKLNPIKSSEYKTLAKRPKYSLLLNTKIEPKMRMWSLALEDYLNSK